MSKLTLAGIGEQRKANNEARKSMLNKIGENEPTDAQKELLDGYKATESRLSSLYDELKQIDGVSNALSQPREEIPTGRAPAQPRQPEDGRYGYRNFHDFLTDVHAAPMKGQIPERLMKAQTGMLNAAGSDEQSVSSDPYGGFLAPPAFLATLLQVDPETDPTARGGLAPVFEVPVAASSVDIPARVDKNHSTSVTGGLRVHRRAETQSPSSSRMELEQVTLKPKSLFGLAYATEEILAHSAITMSAILENGFRQEFMSEIFDEKINGTGAGELEGILNCPAAVSITRNTSSDIKGADIIAMRKRAWNYGRCIWIANHDTLGSLEVAHRSGTNADTFYFRAGSVIPGIGQNASVDIPDTLLGRPIVFSEYVPALGSAGDLILWDPSQYLYGVGTAPGATGSAESIHVRFENHERTFKFFQMNDGRCWWRSALTPRNGANTLSPIVYIAA